MQRKLLRGFHWIGEATKPDKIELKVVKLVFGLEAMIGGWTWENKRFNSRKSSLFGWK